MFVPYKQQMTELEERRVRAVARLRRNTSIGMEEFGNRLGLPPIVRKHPYASVAAAALFGGAISYVWGRRRRGAVETQRVKVEVDVTDHRKPEPAAVSGNTPADHLTALLQNRPTPLQALQAVSKHFGTGLLGKMLTQVVGIASQVEKYFPVEDLTTPPAPPPEAAATLGDEAMG